METVMDSHVSFSTPHGESCSLLGMKNASLIPEMHCCCTCEAFQASWEWNARILAFFLAFSHFIRLPFSWI
jgi:hypothetical protein